MFPKTRDAHFMFGQEDENKKEVEDDLFEEPL